MNNLQVFKFKNHDVRMIDKNGEPWWVLKDVCNVLDLRNPSMLADRLDDDERAKFNLGRQGETNIINESGLYNVILRSDKPEAKAFKRWVTHEVLPSIRKTGGYGNYRPDYKRRAVKPMEFENTLFGKVRGIRIGREPYLAAADVAKALGYRAASSIVSYHFNEPLKVDVLTRMGIQGMNFLNAAEAVQFAENSRNLATDKFIGWVRDEILPALQQAVDACGRRDGTPAAALPEGEAGTGAKAALYVRLAELSEGETRARYVKEAAECLKGGGGNDVV
jgi:prophage antirepressor-like protein